MINNADSIVLCIPSAALGAGIGMRYLEETDIPVLKDIGWLGSRSAIVLGTLGGVPLLIWSFAKAVFAKTLNSITLENFDALKSFDKGSDRKLNLVVDGLSLYPIFCMHMPNIIRGCKGSNELHEKMTTEIKLITDRVQASAQYWKL